MFFEEQKSTISKNDFNNNFKSTPREKINHGDTHRIIYNKNNSSDIFNTILQNSQNNPKNEMKNSNVFAHRIKEQNDIYENYENKNLKTSLGLLNNNHQLQDNKSLKKFSFKNIIKKTSKEKYLDNKNQMSINFKKSEKENKIQENYQKSESKNFLNFIFYLFFNSRKKKP